MREAPHGSDAKTAPNQVPETAATWPGVTTRSTPRGAVAVVVDEREIGHVHLDRATLDLPLGARKAEVLRQGRAKDWADDWVTKALKTDADAEDGVALLRVSYDEQHAG